jgi:N-acetylmuramoyl-L-alanine amidase
VHSNAAGMAGEWSAAEGIETWFSGNSRKGKALASAFQAHLMAHLGWKDRGIRFHEPPEKAFYVLRKTSMPAVLTENGFYTNLEETRKLLDPAVRQKIAQAHVDAILEIEQKGIDNISTYPKIQKIEKK